MSKVHICIGNTSTEAVSLDQAVLVLLPETIRPAAVPTYSGQLYAGVKVLVRLGNKKNIFTNHILPYLGVVDENVLATKKRELDSLRADINEFSGDASGRAGVFMNYLSANHLIDRQLYPILEKLRRKIALTSKDLVPLVDAVYTKNSGGNFRP